MDQVEIEKIKLRAAFENSTAVGILVTGGFIAFATLLSTAHETLQRTFMGQWPTKIDAIKMVFSLCLICVSVWAARDTRRDAMKTLDGLRKFYPLPESEEAAPSAPEAR